MQRLTSCSCSPQSKGKYEVIAGSLKSPDELVDMYQALLLKYPAVAALIQPLRKEVPPRPSPTHPALCVLLIEFLPETWNNMKQKVFLARELPQISKRISVMSIFYCYINTVYTNRVLLSTFNWTIFNLLCVYFLFDQDVDQWERLSSVIGASCSLLCDTSGLSASRAPPPALPGVKGQVLQQVNGTKVSDLIRIMMENPGMCLVCVCMCVCVW